MGYDYIAMNCRPTHKEAREFFDKEFTWTSETGARRVLASSIKGGVYYAAVERTLGDFREVFAVIHKISGYKDGFTYWYGGKSMDETMHPYYYDCPLKILNLLTPTDNEQARAWREKCRAQHKRPNLSGLPIGTNIRFICPFDTTAYKQGETVTLEKMPKRFNVRTGRQTTMWSDGLYRWPTKMIPDSFDVLEVSA